MDETRIDAAPTPAHVFAYRAFRSVFVHSPEATPARPPASLNDDKENARVLPVGSSRFATSPSLSKRKGAERDALSLTPKRQKTVAVSPTKSILKNPNAPTPKRAGLRDVTVTFKDLRKSASPELARRPVGAKVRSQSELRTVSESVVVKDVGRIVQPKATSVELRAVSDPVLSGDRYRNAIAEIMQDPTFDLHDYLAKTEKDVRRFMAYASKWKKQAQQQGEENAKLKALLDEAQKENNRLGRRMALKEKESEVYDTQPALDAELEKVAKEEVERSSERRRTSKSTGHIPDNDTSAEHVRRAPIPAHGRSRSVGQQERSRSSEAQSRRQQGRQQEQQDSKATRNIESAPVRMLTSTARRKDTSNDPVVCGTTNTSLQTGEQHHEAELALPLRSASTSVIMSANRTSVTQDRQAAARERLRQKAEERKGSMRLSVVHKGAEIEKPNKSGPFGSSKFKADESELNWADLG